eukprot:8900718-Alexandrium_andersonii.AAC.1
MGDASGAADGGEVKQAIAKLEGAGEKRPAADGDCQKRTSSGPPSKAPKAARWTDKFTKMPAPADGSCLWHALSGALGQRKVFLGGAERVRAVVVAHMREHPD